MIILRTFRRWMRNALFSRGSRCQLPNSLFRMSREDSSSLPQDTVLLEHQVAGHLHGKGKTKLGILKHKDGTILKPLIKGDKRSDRELEFYKKVFNPDCIDPEVLALRHFVPEFRGVWTTKINNKDQTYLCLRDSTGTFCKPCILDVKIGARTYDPEATEEKKAVESNKYPAGHVICFRILGMRVFQNCTKKYIVYGKDYGLQLNPESVIDAFKTFLQIRGGSPVPFYLKCLLRKLKRIENWFTNQRNYAFYSSSLLIVYEGNTNGDSKQFQCEQLCQKSQFEINCTAKPEEMTTSNQIHCPYPPTEEHCKCSDVKMIDFAHVFPTDQDDHNYLSGLRNLIQVFEGLDGLK